MVCFKVGDTVRCIRGTPHLEEGRAYIVSRVTEYIYGSFVSLKEILNPHSYTVSRFVIVETEEVLVD